MNCNRYAAALLGLALMAAVKFSLHLVHGLLCAAAYVKQLKCAVIFTLGADKAIVAEVDERPNVEIRKVHRQSVDQLMSYTATVEAFKTNNITTSTPNRIKSILVDVGYKVAKGQKLVVQCGGVSVAIH